MTPQEKAKELCDKMYEQSAKIWAAKNRKATAKACALICVDEIHDALMAIDGYKANILLSYFSDVKTEITKY